MEGRTVAEVAGRTDKGPLEVSRMNVNAIGLLEKDRSLDAQRMLERALALEPNNPFTINNLGFVMEKQGELQKALSYYNRAANIHSDEKVLVTVQERREWRGKKISD